MHQSTTSSSEREAVATTKALSIVVFWSNKEIKSPISNSKSVMSLQQQQQPKYAPLAPNDDTTDHFALLGADMTESLTRPASVPTATSTCLIQVTAPATLPEGYVFETSLGERLVQVTVPAGGVEQGQVFSVPLPADVESVVHNKIQIPVGHWRDGLFCGNLCNYGVCHAHCWTACCCTTSE